MVTYRQRVKTLPTGNNTATIRNGRQWRNETKFHRLPAFGKVLPLLREQVQKDMAKPELTEQKVIATVISLMEKTYIRIGSSDYEKLYGSYGLTTLKDSHVQVNGTNLQFTFQREERHPPQDQHPQQKTGGGCAGLQRHSGQRAFPVL